MFLHQVDDKEVAFPDKCTIFLILEHKYDGDTFHRLRYIENTTVKSQPDG